MSTDKISKPSKIVNSDNDSNTDLSFQDELYKVCIEISSLVKDIKKRVLDSR